MTSIKIIISILIATLVILKHYNHLSKYYINIIIIIILIIIIITAGLVEGVPDLGKGETIYMDYKGLLYMDHNVLHESWKRFPSNQPKSFISIL